jgi:3-oxoacyl-[acyl-carrier protein] reductase
VSRFTDKVAAITGAGDGIGAATTARLASEGAAVALLDLIAPQHVAEEIGETFGGVARAYACGITDQSAVQTAFARIATEMDGPHIVDNNAGITRDDLLFRLSEADWDAVIAVNLPAPS